MNNSKNISKIKFSFIRFMYLFLITSISFVILYIGSSGLSPAAIRILNSIQK